MYNSLLLIIASLIFSLVGSVSIKDGVSRWSLSRSLNSKYGLSLILFSLFLLSFGIAELSACDCPIEKSLIVVSLLVWICTLLIGGYFTFSVRLRRILTITAIGFLVMWFSFKSDVVHWSDWFLLGAYSFWAALELLNILYRRKPGI